MAIIDLYKKCEASAKSKREAVSQDAVMICWGKCTWDYRLSSF